MGTTELLSMIVLGGLLGSVGQGVRVIIGLKKAMEEAPGGSVSVARLFEGRTLIVGLLIGFIAGALAVIALNAEAVSAAASPPEPGAPAATVSWSHEQLLGLVAAGYAGTDFIEGIVKKKLPLGNGRAAGVGAL